MPTETSEQLRSRISRSHQHLVDAIKSLEAVHKLGIVTIGQTSIATLQGKKKKVRALMK